jgi:hypothetical protein
VSLNSYLDRLLKMIPAEVVCLYLVGSGLIPDDLRPQDRGISLAVWGFVCLVGVVLVRAYGTADLPNNLPVDWRHVAISSVAMVLWVYSLGGPFEAFGLHVPFLGSLLVLAWTFFVPIFYEGPKD